MYDALDPVKRADISAILELASLYNDRLLFKSFHPIHGWLAEGCDIDRDILPAIKEVIERRHKGRNATKIDSFSYFTNPILDFRQRRLAQDKREEASNPARDADWERRKAERVAWVVRKAPGMRRPDMERWLAEYEAKHGTVAI